MEWAFQSKSINRGHMGTGIDTLMLPLLSRINLRLAISAWSFSTEHFFKGCYFFSFFFLLNFLI